MYEPLAELLRPYQRAATGAEMDDTDPIYALLNRAGSQTPEPGQEGALPGIEATSIQEYARKLARQMFGRGQWDDLNALVTQESGWNPRADNPTSTAYGLFQFLDSTRANYGLPLHANPRRQVRAGLDYVADRYGSPEAAWNFHQREGWY